MKRHHAVTAIVVFGLVVLLGQARDAAADQITVVCSNGLKAVLEDLVPKFEHATKHTVVVKYGLAAAIKQRIEGGEAFDVAFVTPAVMDDLLAHNKIAGDTRTTIARSGLALAIRKGALKTDISTVGDAEIGVLPLSEILPVPGLDLLGPFPPDVQTYIVMVGGVNAASTHAKTGRELIGYVTAPAALSVIKAKGMEK
jgi:ABC-type molybdate transport system substrate-binding protein